MSRQRFIWLYGVLGWGITAGTLFAWIMSGIRPGGFGFWLSISLVLFPIGGYFWGVWVWKRLNNSGNSNPTD